MSLERQHGQAGAGGSKVTDPEKTPAWKSSGQPGEIFKIKVALWVHVLDLLVIVVERVRRVVCSLWFAVLFLKYLLFYNPHK